MTNLSTRMLFFKVKKTKNRYINGSGTHLESVAIRFCSLLLLNGYDHRRDISANSYNYIRVEIFSRRTTREGKSEESGSGWSTTIDIQPFIIFYTMQWVRDST